jgi:hypothetical protein
MMDVLAEMVLGGLDSGLEQTTCSALVKLFADFEDATSVQDLTAKILEHRVETNKKLLGLRCLHCKFLVGRGTDEGYSMIQINI